ncbi:MAG: FTR1 family iron permease [Thermoleophilia bacterium]
MTVLLVFTFILGLSTDALAAARTWADVAQDTNGFLGEASAAYQRDAAGDAKRLIDEAYFGPFEADGLEATIKGYISAKRAFELEQLFKEAKVAIAKGAPAGEVVDRLQTLQTMIAADAQVLDGGQAKSGGASSVVVQSLLIILREGFEAILVLSAVIAYLVRTNGGRGVRAVYAGAAAALLASGATALILRSLFAGAAGFTQELLEGVTMLLAVAVLFWVSYWLASKAQASRWEKYIRGKVLAGAGQAVSGKRTLALAAAAFLAVYREGAETILFYGALLSGSPGSGDEAVMGFGVGVVLLTALFLGFRWGSVRLPIGPFFAVTSALLYYLAFVFAGKGIRELQEAGVVGATRIDWVPLVDAIGLYPTLETLSLQAALVVAALFALAWQLGGPGRRGQGGELQANPPVLSEASSVEH